VRIDAPIVVKGVDANGVMQSPDNGDRIEVRLADGTTFVYAVAVVNTFEAASAPVDQIVGPTTRETVTLITCAGQFNRQTRQYDKRLVVRAEGV